MAPWALGGVSLVLAVGLALMGLLNRRSMEVAAGQAYEGRALDIGLGAASALWRLRPAGREALNAALEELAEGPVVSLVVVGPMGRVVGSSDALDDAVHPGIHRASAALGREGAIHYLERLLGGDRPRYRVWIRIRPGLRPGLRRFDRREGFGREGFGREEHSRGGRSRGGIRREERRREAGLATIGRALVAVDVEIDDPRIASAVNRARLVQGVTLAASGALLLFALLALLAQRRAERWRRRTARDRRLAEMGEMAAVLAHEIRNPLGVIKGYAQLLGERTNGEESGTIEAVVAETARLERLVNGLLDFARPAPPRLREVSVEDLLVKACELMAEEANRLEVRLVTDLASLVASADPDQVLQVVLNLLRNALEASEPGGVVTLRSRRQGEALLVEVVDQGVGLPAPLGEDIFKPFVTTKPRGTGLGLAVCRQIAEAHGGTLRARAGAERGAVFALRLPLHGRASGDLGRGESEP